MQKRMSLPIDQPTLSYNMYEIPGIPLDLLLEYHIIAVELPVIDRAQRNKSQEILCTY